MGGNKGGGIVVISYPWFPGAVEYGYLCRSNYTTTHGLWEFAILSMPWLFRATNRRWSRGGGLVIKHYFHSYNSLNKIPMIVKIRIILLLTIHDSL